jgi:hypothetical protein
MRADPDLLVAMGALYLVVGILALGGSSFMFHRLKDLGDAGAAAEISGIQESVRREVASEPLKERLCNRIESDHDIQLVTFRFLRSLVEVMLWISCVPVLSGIHMIAMGRSWRRAPAPTPPSPAPPG